MKIRLSHSQHSDLIVNESCIPFMMYYDATKTSIYLHNPCSFRPLFHYFFFFPLWTTELLRYFSPTLCNTLVDTYHIFPLLSLWTIFELFWLLIISSQTSCPFSSSSLTRVKPIDWCNFLVILICGDMLSFSMFAVQLVIKERLCVCVHIYMWLDTNLLFL